MKPIRVKFTETQGISRVREPVKIGVPVPVGEVYNTRDFTLLDKKNRPVEFFNVSITATWVDGSIKWLLLEFFATVEANEELCYTLENLKQPSSEFTNVQSNSQITDNFEGEFSVQVNLANSEICIGAPDTLYRLRCAFSDESNVGKSIQFISSNLCPSSNSVRQTLLIEARLELDSEKFLNFRFKLHSYCCTGKIKLEACVHNPQAAKHYGGLWDLGDPGSILFREFSVLLVSENRINTTIVKDSVEGESLALDAGQIACIAQYSSGGLNEYSPAHRDAENRVERGPSGYRILIDDEIVGTGARATPVVKITSGLNACLAGVNRFWENYPSAIDYAEDTLALKFFPNLQGPLYELQGGEKKRFFAEFEVLVDPVDKEKSVEEFLAIHTPLVPRLDPLHWQETGVVANFSVSNGETALDALVSKGLYGKNNFFEKRELIDEFGWRNFGDIYADHESLYIDKTKQFPNISHYNNQYDAIYGFFVQYIVTSDLRWYELMMDLSHHVCDIDIYHTTQDRNEFNGGLFWHTDHYVDAHTATHRTFSKRQLAADGSVGAAGGGPTAEHCYTTGLMYHYFTTGDMDSRDAVLGLAQWMVNSDTPVTGLLSAVDSIRRVELPRLKQVLRKERNNSNRQPFTRATGNYISALIDAYEVSGDYEWIKKCDQLILQSIHPADFIDLRDLGNIEITWSYVCLLQGVSRYLLTKEKMKSFDEFYLHARASVMHYCGWMLENEALYFDSIESLEYPNATWIAQEIRKCNMMITGARYDSRKRAEYLSKAKHFLDFLEENLASSEELELARIQVILLQNYCLANSLYLDTFESWSESQETYEMKKDPKDTIVSLAVSVVYKLSSGLMKFSPRKEKAWIQARLDSRK